MYASAVHYVFSKTLSVIYHINDIIFSYANYERRNNNQKFITTRCAQVRSTDGIVWLRHSSLNFVNLHRSVIGTQHSKQNE